MVRHAGMSRGCATCRKRRIKCDEKSPSCTQCSRGKRPCPGSVRGRIFLLTHQDNPRKRSRQEGAPSPDLLQETKCQNPDKYANSTRASHEKQIYADHAVNGVHDENNYSLQTDLCVVASPPDTRLTEIQLSKNNSWMAILPDIMLNGGSRRAVELRSSVLAGSFALCGSIRRSQKDKGDNTTLEIESRKFYLTSLKQQRVKMILGAHSSEKIIPLVEDVAVAVMLAYYEVITPTFDETSYFQHILGAKALLEMIGPSNCREGYYHQLFRTVRLYMVQISITTQSLTSFSSKEWTEIPFSAGGKTSCDHIIDVLLQLPRLKLSNTSYMEVQHKPYYSNIIGFIDELKCIWTKSGFCQQTTKPKSNMDVNMDMPDTKKTTTTKRHEIEVGDFDFIPGSSTILSSSEAAITISFYSLAWILILDHIQVHYPEMMKLHEDLLLGHCDAVLRACNYIEEMEDGCGLIRTVFPLRSVALLSPSFIQRESARYRLDFWRVSKGLGGICAVAMSPKISR